MKFRNASASGPRVSTCPMCETSNTPASRRTARCSSRIPAYWIGIAQPANAASFAPAAAWLARRHEWTAAFDAELAELEALSR